MKKKIISLVLALIFLMSLGHVAYASTSDGLKAKVDKKTSIYLFGKKVKTDVINYNNDLYVPLMDACAWFKCDFRIDNEKRSVEILSNQPSAKGIKAYNGTLIKNAKPENIKLNDYSFKLNGIITYMGAVEYKDEVFVPLTYFAKLLDFQATMQKSKGKLVVTKFAEKSIGTVNGEIITQHEFDYYYNFSLRQQTIGNENNAMTAENIKKLRNDVFNYLVEDKIVSKKIDPSAYRLRAKDFERISEALVATVRKFGGIKSFNAFLDSHNLTMAQVENDLKANYIREFFIRNSTVSTEATDSEILKYFDENKASLKREAQVRAKHILVSISDTDGNTLEERKANTKKKAEDILSRIKAGESFDKLMNEYSNDPGLKGSPNGYTFGRGVMVKEFEDVAFALKAGEVSGLVETVYGYHIIKVEEVFPERLLSFDEVKTVIKDKLDSIKKADAWKSMVQKWTEESKITNLMK